MQLNGNKNQVSISNVSTKQSMSFQISLIHALEAFKKNNIVKEVKTDSELTIFIYKCKLPLLSQYNFQFASHLTQIINNFADWGVISQIYLKRQYDQSQNQDYEIIYRFEKYEYQQDDLTSTNNTLNISFRSDISTIESPIRLLFKKHFSIIDEQKIIKDVRNCKSMDIQVICNSKQSSIIIDEAKQQKQLSFALTDKDIQDKQLLSIHQVHQTFDSFIKNFHLHDNLKKKKQQFLNQLKEILKKYSIISLS